MSLRICWPVSQGDYHLLAQKVDLLRALGGAPRHNLMLLPTRSCISHAHQAADKLKSCCASVEVVEWQDENYQPWPRAGNFMWRHAVDQIMAKAVRGDQSRWFWEEMDTTQLAPFAHDRLEHEDRLSNCSFTGTTSPNRIDLGNGKWTEARFIHHQPENIPFMVSVAVYPHNVHDLTGGVWRSAIDMPFDKFLRYYWYRSLHTTKLIQHQWRTENFHEVEGQIIGEDSQRNKDEEYKHGGPLSPEAVFHHGCKDGSLAKLIRERLRENPALLSAPEFPQDMVDKAVMQEQAPAPAPTVTFGRPGRGQVGFDQEGWNIVQNGMAGPPKAPMIPSGKPLPPLEFEEEARPAPKPRGRPKKKAVLKKRRVTEPVS